MRVYLHCVSTNLWNFYTNKTVNSSTVCHLVEISKETPHLVHVSGKGYLYMSSHGTGYSGITDKM